METIMRPIVARYVPLARFVRVPTLNSLAAGLLQYPRHSLAAR